jgi:hypothetical protein
MEDLTKNNNLSYFTNNELNRTIGLIVIKNNPIMWFKERDDIITRTKYVKKLNDTFYEYEDCEKLQIHFGELDSTCICSRMVKQYLAIITLNTDPTHKATYKLHLYEIVKHSNYIDTGIYYSYYS